MFADSQTALKDFKCIPGVGKAMARDFYDLGYRSVEELKGQDPESMYLALCGLRGTHIDRCVLYVFRCAAYFASHDVHEPELLKWWNWKDAASRDRKVRAGKTING